MTYTFKQVFIIITAVGFVVTGFFLIWVVTLELPTVEDFETRKVTQSTKIYDRTGEILLFDVHEDIRRTVIPFEDISRHVKNATIAIEDVEFYQHSGVKPRAFIRALLANIATQSFGQGGSTITQQVVKNTLLTPEKTITRKVKEWILALKLEKTLSKNEILEVYLNESPYGGNIYGIAEAAKYFFGIEATELSVAQAAYLAALPQAPTFYSPYGGHLDKLEDRKNLVLFKMNENGFLDTDEYKYAQEEQVEFIPHDDTGIEAPHFVFYIREYLEEKYGVDAVYNGGLKVITTIDYVLQKKASEIVGKFALENEEKFNAENASLVAIDPKTGQILAMVGSRNYFDETIDGKFNVATAYRQPGSTFKPFVYATALERGYTPETVVFDVQTQFSTNCEPTDLSNGDGCYAPKNYDDVFRGPITFRNALAQSINIPAVKALYLAGLENSLATAIRMGLKSLDKGIGFYGSSLVLGGGEVSLLELTSAYGVFANDGVRNPPVGILRIEDSIGTILEEYTATPEQVISKQAARQISDILSDNDARAPSYGQRSFLYFDGIDVAAKTGTTNDFKDVWVVGYTPTIAVGTWAGNNDNSPIVKKVAGFVIAPMWRAFMDEALQIVQHDSFIDPEPENEEFLKPVLKNQWNVGGQVHSILYWVNRGDPRGLSPISPDNDGQYRAWEYGVANWVTKNNPVLLLGATTSSASTQGISIVSPQNNSTHKTNTILSVFVAQSPGFALANVEYYFDGLFIGSVSRQPFSVAFTPTTNGLHTIRAVGTTKDGTQATAISSFYTQ